jgi:hypothetical protein
MIATLEIDSDSILSACRLGKRGFQPLGAQPSAECVGR